MMSAAMVLTTVLKTVATPSEDLHVLAILDTLSIQTDTTVMVN